MAELVHSIDMYFSHESDHHRETLQLSPLTSGVTTLNVSCAMLARIILARNCGGPADWYPAPYHHNICTNARRYFLRSRLKTRALPLISTTHHQA